MGGGGPTDTYNLPADGIKKPTTMMTRGAKQVESEAWAGGPGPGRCLGSTIKGQAEMDFDDDGPCQALLLAIMHHSDRLLTVVRAAVPSLTKRSEQTKQVLEAAALMAPVGSAVCLGPGPRALLREGLYGRTADGPAVARWNAKARDGHAQRQTLRGSLGRVTPGGPMPKVSSGSRR